MPHQDLIIINNNKKKIMTTEIKDNYPDMEIGKVYAVPNKEYGF